MITPPDVKQRAEHECETTSVKPRMQANGGFISYFHEFSDIRSGRVNTDKGQVFQGAAIFQICRSAILP